MPSSPPKRLISDFFQPHVKSSVPAKRSSPLAEDDDDDIIITHVRSNVSTPKSDRRGKESSLRTPRHATFSPLSAPGSRVSLSIPIRSPRPTDTAKSTRTYQTAPTFGTGKKVDRTSTPQKGSFSFPDAPASSRPAVPSRNVVEILDSDDDGSSIASLHDIFESLRAKPGEVTSRSSSPDVDNEATSRKSRKSRSEPRKTIQPSLNKSKLQTLLAKERAQKFDISAVLDDHFGDEEIRQRVSKAQTDYKESTKPSGQARVHDFDRKLLAAVVKDDDGEDDVSRLMDAVDRTEALETERVYSFFGSSGLTDWRGQAPVKNDFCEEAMTDRTWQIGDTQGPTRAFCSGYMAERAAAGTLSDEILTWIMNNVLLEEGDHVREAYIQCLENASPRWTRTNVSANDVQRLFQTLGTDNANFQDSILIEPKHRLLQEPPRRDPRYLLSLLDLFQAICADMDFIALSLLTSLLCRLAIDVDMMNDASVCRKVEGALERLLSLPDTELRSHVTDRILSDVGQYLQSPVLQAQLLAHILPTSNTAVHVRIQLAQAFLLGSSATTISTTGRSPISLDTLTNHISTSHSFSTRRHKSTLDYVALRCLTQILDIAIADGGRPASFSSKGAEATFNASVDALADELRAVFVAIADAGASHMRRTEAKDLLQALHWRLLFAVRTTPRPKRNIFDGRGKLRDEREVRDEVAGGEFMRKFLGTKGSGVGDEQQVDAEAGGLGPPSASSSEPSETEKSIRNQLGL